MPASCSAGMIGKLPKGPQTMSYKQAFPDFPDTDIPPVFLAAPWTDGSWRNDTCPSFWRVFCGTRQVHVYVDYTDPTKRDMWTTRDGDQAPLPKYSVRFTNDEGCFVDDEPLDFSADSLAHVLDQTSTHAGGARSLLAPLRKENRPPTEG